MPLRERNPRMPSAAASTILKTAWRTWVAFRRSNLLRGLIVSDFGDHESVSPIRAAFSRISAISHLKRKATGNRLFFWESWLGRQDPKLRNQPLPEGIESRTYSPPTSDSVLQPCATGKGGSGCWLGYEDAVVGHLPSCLVERNRHASQAAWEGATKPTFPFAATNSAACGCTGPRT